MKNNTVNARQTLMRNEEGFASIVIGLTLILILALVSVGFAQLTRREQQNALDKQLSVQAYYASESGINDAVYDIQKGLLTNDVKQCNSVPSGTSPSALLSRSTTSSHGASHAEQLSGTYGVSYSCVTVNFEPGSLSKPDLTDQSGWTTVFSTIPSQTLRNLTITWSSASTPAVTTLSSNSLSPTAKLPARSNWTYPALMEASITPLNDGVTIGSLDLSQSGLIGRDFTTYGYPALSNNGVTSVPYGGSVSANEGVVQPATCGLNTVVNKVTCSLTITGFDSFSSGPYLLHLIDHYNPSDISITGQDPSGIAIKFIGAQAVIDSTGRAQDTLRRTQVRQPIGDNNGDNHLPNNAIEAGDVCKRITTNPTPASPTNPVPPGGSTDTFINTGNGVATTTSGAGGGDDPCNLD